MSKDMAVIGRAGEVEELAKVASFLVSDDCTFVHGEDIYVDGGMMLK